MVDKNEIETTLAQINDHYADYEPFTRVAEAVIQQGSRRVEYIYDISHERDTDELQVSAKYYNGDELVNESTLYQTYPVEDGVVYHTDTGQELMAFIEANAFADPEVSVSEEYESMV